MNATNRGVEILLVNNEQTKLKGLLSLPKGAGLVCGEQRAGIVYIALAQR